MYFYYKDLHSHFFYPISTVRCCCFLYKGHNLSIIAKDIILNLDSSELNSDESFISL